MPAQQPAPVQWPALNFGPLNLWRVTPAWQWGQPVAPAAALAARPVRANSAQASAYALARNR